MINRILVFSDTHGHVSLIDKLAERFELYDKIVFCGDGIRDIENWRLAYPNKFVAVMGNCDGWADGINDCEDFSIGGVNFFVTHGHRYYARYGTEALVSAAMGRGAKCVLYGHTHVWDISDSYGITLINGGSLGEGLRDRASYADIVIKDQIIFPEIVKL